MSVRVSQVALWAGGSGEPGQTLGTDIHVQLLGVPESSQQSQAGDWKEDAPTQDCAPDPSLKMILFPLPDNNH